MHNSDTEHFLPIAGLTDPGAFAAEVVGDSMTPEYRRGDIAVFSPEAEIEYGSCCFIRTSDREIFSRVFFEDGGRRVRLVPLNPDFPAESLEARHVIEICRMVYLYRKTY